MLIENVLAAEKLGRDCDSMIAKWKDDLANVTPLGKELDPLREQALTWFLRGQIRGLQNFKKKLLATDEQPKDE